MIWNLYVFHKQTVREIALWCRQDRRIIRTYLDAYANKPKLHSPRPIHLVVDATYFGERTEQTSWCVSVARDPHTSENLVWRFDPTETTYVYALIRDELEDLGYTILSVTGDGFAGIRSAFHGIPFQMCHVHMERLVIQGVTRRPQTEAGRVLLALTRTLPKTTRSIFETRLNLFLEKYRPFLNEKTIHPISGDWSWTHDGVRNAYRSLHRLLPYLFTFEQNKNIPNTTNTLEGHFSHLNEVVGIHRGLTKHKKQKVLSTILHASSIAPTPKILNEIL